MDERAQPDAGPAGSVDAVLGLLRSAGGRVTQPRRLLLEVLFRSAGHRSAAELAAEVQARAPEVHLSTIYRNLEELQRLGVIVHSHLGHGPATYHLATTAHAHLVCETCGATVQAPEAAFSELVRIARDQLGFEVNPYHFAVPGRCAACAAADPDAIAEALIAAVGTRLSGGVDPAGPPAPARRRAHRARRPRS